MSYSFESRVRYSEVGPDGKLTVPGIINYFQDCCIFHSESIGKNVDVNSKDGRVWVLMFWQIVVSRYPGLGESIKVKTWPYDFKGFMGSRNFVLETVQGESLAWANSLWSLVDMATGMPAKLVPEDIEGYELEERFPMEYAGRKIRLNGPVQREKGIRVMHSQVDTNQHMNNGQYVRMAQEYLPEEFSVGEIRVEYKQQARLGDRIYPGICREDNRFYVSLDDERGKAYCISEFIERPILKDEKIR